MHTPNYQTVFLFICYLVCFVLSACSFSTGENANTSKTCSILPATSKQIDLPDFLEAVYPAPRSVIKKVCYTESLEGLSKQVGIYAIVITEKMIEAGDDLNIDTINERISIKVHPTPSEDPPQTFFGIDAMELQKHDEKGNLIAVWGGPTAWKSMPVELAPGEYLATIQVRKTSDKVLEYSWTFTIEP
ncbi:MAG: hypothetical protein GY797_19365 [Deltaproteobacteria bacterium]|nr:hypothetical protein [Deltaproteobacteria bacterium]